MSVGNQYLYYDDETGWQDGYFQLNSTTTPTTITFANNDFNFVPVFPLSSTYTGTATPSNFTMGFYSSDQGLFAIALRVLYTPVATTATTTTYAILTYSRNVSSTFDPNTSYSMLFRYPEPSAALASLRSQTSDQTISSGSATTVALGTVDIATTDSNQITANTSTSLITCVVTGMFKVSGKVTWLSTLLGTGYQLGITVNGTVVQTVQAQSTLAGFGISQNISAIVNVTSANTTIGLQVLQSSGSNKTLEGTGAAASCLFVHRIA